MIYLVIAYVTELGRPQQTFATDLPLSTKTYSASASLFLIVIGVGCLFFGAFFAVDFSVLAARMLHVGQVAIALTVVAIGTALPELGATMASARRGHAYAASSQLLASSIFNLLLVFGIAICARPMSVAPGVGQNLCAGASGLCDHGRRLHAIRLAIDPGSRRHPAGSLFRLYRRHRCPEWCFPPRLMQVIGTTRDRHASLVLKPELRTKTMQGDFQLHARLSADTLHVTDWPLSQILLMNDVRYWWLILVPRRSGLSEIHDLPK